MSEPELVRVDLTELQDEGVLMAANAAFFWPLGLALTWVHDTETGIASELHVREWRYDDGHHEAIGLEMDDLARERQSRFASWLMRRDVQP